MVEQNSIFSLQSFLMNKIHEYESLLSCALECLLPDLDPNQEYKNSGKHIFG